MILNCVRNMKCDATPHEDPGFTATWALQNALSRKLDVATMPKIKKLDILYTVRAELRDHLNCATCGRLDCVRRPTGLMPHRTIAEVPGEACLNWLRSPEHGEIIGTKSVIETIAEGDCFSPLLGPPCAKLPEEMVSSSKTALITPATSWNREDWSVENPGKSCTLWQNDKASGMTLVLGKIMNEFRNAFDLQCIRQTVPEGWTVDEEGLVHGV